MNSELVYFNSTDPTHKSKFNHFPGQGIVLGDVSLGNLKTNL